MLRIALLIFAILSCRSRTLLTSNRNADSLINAMRNGLVNNYNDKNSKEAQRYLDSLRPTIIALKNTAATSVWLAYKGRTYIDYQSDSAKCYLDSALYLAELSRQPKAKVIAKMQLVSYLIQQKNLDSALRHALEALELSAINPPPELPLLYFQLSYLYWAADDSFNYRKYLFEGLKISKEPVHIAAFSSDIGRYYINKNQIDSAVFFFKNFQMFNKFSADYIDARKFEDLGYLLLSQNRPKEGIENLKQAILLHKKDGRVPSSVYLSVGTEYSILGNNVTAGTYFDTALSIARQTKDLENVSNSLFHKSTIFLKQGKSAQAYQLLDSSYILHLQYDTIAFRNQAKSLEAKVRGQIKDQQIASLAQDKRVAEKISRQQWLLITILTIATILAVTLGMMLVRRRKLQHQLLETEWQQYSLRSQMEPHFMSNALSALQSFIRGNNQREAIDYIQQLSKLLRQSFNNTSKTFVPLKEEITFLDRYLSLQALQLENKFEYRIETYPSYENDNVSIPPMILQPFIENTIMHGFTNLEYKGNIVIKFARENNTLCCVIDDNGIGLLDQKSGSEKRLNSTAIIKKRLMLLAWKTGRKASLKITDKGKNGNGSGVNVSIYIPFTTPN